MTGLTSLPNADFVRNSLRLPGLSTIEIRLFAIGLFLKLLAGGLLASDYLVDLFIPFVEQFVADPLGNPYAAFVAAGNGNAFPYPAAMLYVLAVPEAFLQLFGIESLAVTLFAYRLALIWADVSIYLVMRRWLSSKFTVWLAVFYWLSPVAFYISYIHGQLDVIPIAFLFMSVAALFGGRHILAAILFGIALSAKTSVILIIPIFLLYYVARPGTLLGLVRYSVIVLATFLALNAPFLGDPAFVQMVLMNHEQSKVFALSMGTETAQFQFVIAAFVILVAFAATIGIANRSLFIMFIGFMFSVILLLIPPMFGWYYWIIPSFAYFFARERNVTPVVFFVLQGMYLLYFLVSPESDYLQVFQMVAGQELPKGAFFGWLAAKGLGAPTLYNIAFTLLQTTLFVLCLQIFRHGIRRYRSHMITGRPFLLGIGGNSGTGKSTLTTAIAGIFTDENATVIRGDDRHKWPRGHEEWARYTHLNPKANHLHTEIDALRLLKNGRKVWRSMYDHSTGTFTAPMPVVANRVMIVEGLHPFYLSDQRDLFDLRVFIDPEESLAMHWKIARDRAKRNYGSAQIMEQIERRRKDVELYVNSQRQFADIVVSPRAVQEIVPFGEAQAVFDIEYDLIISNRISLEPALEILAGFPELQIEHSYTDVTHQKVSIRGVPSQACLDEMLVAFESRLEEIGVQEISWPTGLPAVVTFFIVHAIFEEARNAV